jgi:hypothetical protein
MKKNEKEKIIEKIGGKRKGIGIMDILSSYPCYTIMRNCFVKHFSKTI